MTDWKAEARRILADACGGNDNGTAKTAAAPVVTMDFHAPVTFNLSVSGGGGDANIQRLMLLQRIEGLLRAEENGVAEAFYDQVRHRFGCDADQLTTLQLGDLLQRFEKMLKAARMLAAGR